MIRRKAIELYFDESPQISIEADGSKINGTLAYPGISKNLKWYSIEEIMRGHDLDLPIWLNHATTVGLQGVGPDLLPDSYRRRLENGEKILLGKTHTTFDPNTMQLTYQGIVTDPFYKQKDILSQMSVSQGVWHLPFDPNDVQCDAVACYDRIRDSYYEEMSLVFNPGFGIATLSIENQNSYQLATYLKSIMEDNDKIKTGESKDCGCTKSGEAGVQVAGVVQPAGNCGEGMVLDTATGECVPVKATGNSATNAGGSPHTVSGEADSKDKKYDDDMEKAEEAIELAKKQLEAANEELDKARKAKEAADVPKGKAPPPDDIGKKEEEESKKNSTEADLSGSYNNADWNTRRKAQEAYQTAQEKKYKAMEALQNTILAATKVNMQFAAEQAKGVAMLGGKKGGAGATHVKSGEAQEQSFKNWLDLHIKHDENVSNNFRWNMKDDYLYKRGQITRKFKQAEGYDFKYIDYSQLVKQSEATDVQMAGNGAQPDGFQRTLSELVLVYPDGIVVTPIEQFCEVKIIQPGIKEGLFYDVNVPAFGPTDEANMDAGGSGYALLPSEITVNVTGGGTNPQGGLVRLGFSQMEEFPIDIIEKTNVGFSMRAAQTKNFEVLSTCYNDDTPYTPATMSRRPKGGGDKGAVDDQGNTHWVNMNSGVQLTTGASSDSGVTGAATYNGLLKMKKTIADTGLYVENLMCYMQWGTILQLTNATDITTYTQRSVPEVITEGVIEKLSGVQLIASNDLAKCPTASSVVRSVMFIPTLSFKFNFGRELQMDADRVPRQQSVFLSASLKMAAYCQRIESTCRGSTVPTA